MQINTTTILYLLTGGGGHHTYIITLKEYKLLSDYILCKLCFVTGLKLRLLLEIYIQSSYHFSRFLSVNF